MSAAILIIEDDLSLREMLVDLLDEAGYPTRGATSALEALELAKEQVFQVVIADVRLAGSMDGIGALAVLKSLQPELRCLVMTGFAVKDAPARAIDIQVDDYLLKPFRQSELLDLVGRVLHSGRERSGYRSLLARLLALPRRWLSEETNRSLESERNRSWSGYYVGIRSQLITRGAALDLWDHLDGLETRYLRLTQAEDSQPAQELATSYRQVVELMVGLAESRSIGSLANRVRGQLDRPTFFAFYERVQTGQVTQEQMRVAWQVYKSEPDLREASPEFDELYGLLWQR